MHDRLVDLEIKIAFLEKHVTDLDAVVREMSDHLIALRREVAALAESEAAAKPASASHEAPPHY